MPQNPTQSRGADDRCIGRRVFVVDRRWVDDGTVQALVVSGDAVSRNHTNHLVIAGIPVTDPDPTTMATGYEQGDFDGYAVQATVTDGVLTIAPGAGAFDPTLCFIEIGPEGTTITPDVEARLAELVESMTTATYAPQAPSLARRQYVFGSYVDELVSYTVGTTRYFVHANHLYSPSAITNASGVVVERMRYDAYGKQTITTATGTTRNQSAVGFSRGFTGYILDEETGLYYARARMCSARLGRFIGRDPLRYVDGANHYSAHFVPGGLDPLGESKIVLNSTKTARHVSVEEQIEPNPSYLSGTYRYIMAIAEEAHPWTYPTWSVHAGIEPYENKQPTLFIASVKAWSKLNPTWASQGWTLQVSLSFGWKFSVTNHCCESEKVKVYSSVTNEKTGIAVATTNNSVTNGKISVPIEATVELWSTEMGGAWFAKTPLPHEDKMSAMTKVVVKCVE